jgi:hypothetical protein
LAVSKTVEPRPVLRESLDALWDGKSTTVLRVGLTGQKYLWFIPRAIERCPLRKKFGSREKSLHARKAPNENARRKDTKVYDPPRHGLWAETAAQRSTDVDYIAKLDAINCTYLAVREQ